MTPEILIRDYTYTLPDDRIAETPLAERDHSRLLVWQNGEIRHSRFDALASFLPENAVLFFNDTKVIPARILFTKETGAEIEIFLLQPAAPHLVQAAMQSTGSNTWHCTIGNRKRWAKGMSLTKKTGDVTLTAFMQDPISCVINFSWTPAGLSFAEILQAAGAVPLPPYIKRAVVAEDRHRYQTVYSHADGAVAAPTAGLHFTARGMEALSKKGILTDFLTLHVSAGTFQPVKTENVYDHPMHTEQIIVTRKNLENLLLPDKQIVAVGTTSLRTLESLYWYGVKLLKNPDSPFVVSKLDPYETGIPASENEAFRAILDRMDALGASALHGETSVMILPGYQFKTAGALITNFHQPGSTLMVLVAAFVGEDWRKIYAAALSGGYRFLSYGDSSLLIRGWV